MRERDKQWSTTAAMFIHQQQNEKKIYNGLLNIESYRTKQTIIIIIIPFNNPEVTINKKKFEMNENKPNSFNQTQIPKRNIESETKTKQTKIRNHSPIE